MASSSMDMIDQKILDVLKQQPKIPKELEDYLESAAKAFQTKAYTKAAKYFNDFLDANNKDNKYLSNDDETIVLVTYMSCLCFIESADSKNWWDAVNALEKLVNYQGAKYPMVYWALGKAYVKLYRFGKAAHALAKCCYLIRERNVKCPGYCIPGSNEIIPESTKEGLEYAILGLKEHMLVYHRPNTVCCLNECSNFSANESETKAIFFGSPTFIGMVQVTCNNSCNNCIMRFHVVCWKAKKESLCSSGKLSDKEVLHLECFTPNCVDAKGVRSIIRKIEIIDDQGIVKATIEPRGDDAVKHAKTASTPKGAIKKQQQPKLKNSSEPRAPVVRNPKPPVVQKEVVKVEVAEEGDDLQDEQTLKLAVEKLKTLRAKNFGIKDEKIWKPNLSMYGNDFMLKTAEAMPDPDFSDDRPYDEEKAFVFSYLFEFISNNGPMKLSRLDEKWKEMQMEILGKPCQSISSHHADIGDFLTQSLKLAIVGDYISTADKLPEAYYLARNDACEIVKFFMEPDADENSTGSSLDDEAAFNDFIHQDYDYSMSNSTITNGAQSLNGEPLFVPHASINNKKKCDNEYTNGFASTKDIMEPEEIREINKTDMCPSNVAKSGSSSNVECSGDNVLVDKSATIKNFTPPIQAEKNSTKLPYSLELPQKNTGIESVENGDGEIEKESFIDQAYRHEGGDSPKVTVKGAYSVSDIENHVKSSPLELKILHRISARDTSANETKLTKVYQNQNALINAVCKTSVNSIDSENSKQVPIVENKTATLPNVEAVEKSAIPPPKTNNVLKSMTSHVDNLKLILEVQLLKDELAEIREEKEKLQTDLKVVTDNSTIIIGRLAMDLLTKQYNFNRSALTEVLNELYFEYKLISNIQNILHSSIGTKLPLNESEITSNITEVEKRINNYQEKFIKVRDELSASLVEGNFQSINLPPEQIPDIPKQNLDHVLQSAFGLYRMHFLKEFQNLQMPKGPTSFMPPQFGPIPPYWPPLNVHSNIYNQRPLVNDQNPRNSQPFDQVQQQFAQPNFGSSMLPPPYFGARQYVARPSLPPLNSYLSYPPPLLNPQRPAAPNHLNNPAATELPFNPTRQTTDQVNDQSQANSKFGPQPPCDSNSKQSTTSFLGEPLQFLKDKSNYRGSQEKIAVPDCSLELSNSTGNLAQPHTKINDPSSGAGPSTDSEPVQNHAEIVKGAGDNVSIISQPKTPVRTTRAHSMDKLMRRLRSHYTGVLELDLLKSIECVRKQHNNSLSKLPICRIIQEADNFIGIIQQRQLCGYVKYQPNQYSAVRSPITPNRGDTERMKASTSSGTPLKKESTVSSGSKKKWEPVHIPNESWKKDPAANSECAICFETMSNGNIMTLECQHSFHKQCMRDWHKHQIVIGSCPLCRRHTPIDNEFPPLG
ncbi:uncharacterized protein [Venturia canescens]|uniref:uncharacterized protein isoform X2 n=1 Tax=Venturia canescens TaxID=32260 RepID=UPI001C9BE5D7|nr:uncharacterized protein LOC122406803 isoform X2 [Venturia canescens]